MNTLYTKDCIRTVSGKFVNVFEPEPDMICIEDIAHALSHMCRFGGHLPKFYSVAQHSLLCAEVAEPQHTLQALMHDAAEAYLLDIPSPIKNRLPEYKRIEDNLMQLIAEKYGFDYPLSDEVKKIDRQMLEYEYEHIMLATPVKTKTYYHPIEIFTPQQAKQLFIEKFNELNA